LHYSCQALTSLADCKEHQDLIAHAGFFEPLCALLLRQLSVSKEEKVKLLVQESAISLLKTLLMNEELHALGSRVMVTTADLEGVEGGTAQLGLLEVLAQVTEYGSEHSSQEVATINAKLGLHASGARKPARGK